MPTLRKRNHQQRAQQQRVQQHQQQQQQQQQLSLQQQQQLQPQHSSNIQNQDKRNNGQLNVDPNAGNLNQSQRGNPKSESAQVAHMSTNNTESESGDTTTAVHKNIQSLLEWDLHCAICREIYINPLILNCAHSFCKFCLDHWLSKNVGCPSCRMVVVFQTENLPLKNIINKMVSASSSHFQSERALLLNQRSEAAKEYSKTGIVALMEKRSFNSHGRPLLPATKEYIRSWRAPNGATIWQTKLDRSGRVVADEGEQFSTDDEDDSSHDVEDADEEAEIDDEDGDSDGDDVESIEVDGEDDNGNDNFDDDYLARLDMGLWDDNESRLSFESSVDGDDTSSSTHDADSSDSHASYIASRQQHRNNILLLAGPINSDSDVDFDPGELESHSEEESQSDDESNSSTDSAPSGLEVFGWRRRASELVDYDDSTDVEELSRVRDLEYIYHRRISSDDEDSSSSEEEFWSRGA